VADNKRDNAGSRCYQNPADCYQIKLFCCQGCTNVHFRVAKLLPLKKCTFVHFTYSGSSSLGSGTKNPGAEARRRWAFALAQRQPASQALKLGLLNPVPDGLYGVCMAFLLLGPRTPLAKCAMSTFCLSSGSCAARVEGVLELLGKGEFLKVDDPHAVIAMAVECGAVDSGCTGWLDPVSSLEISRWMSFFDNGAASPRLRRSRAYISKTSLGARKTALMRERPRVQ